MRTVDDVDLGEEEIVFLEPIPYPIVDALSLEISNSVVPTLVTTPLAITRQELTLGSCRYLCHDGKALIGAIYLSAHPNEKTYIRLLVAQGTDKETRERRKWVQWVVAIIFTFIDRFISERDALPTVPRRPDDLAEFDRLGLSLEPAQPSKLPTKTQQGKRRSTPTPASLAADEEAIARLRALKEDEDDEPIYQGWLRKRIRANSEPADPRNSFRQLRRKARAEV